MMFTTSRLMLDSSILVEYAKNARTELLEYLVSRTDIELCINSTVLSEYTYHWLGNNGKKAPRTLQQSHQISKLLNQVDLAVSIGQFTVLPSDNRIIPIYLHLMQRYNLLPNDALVIGTAKLHNISAIASYDQDFTAACADEGIRLVRDVVDLA